jgi:hypothetical protein
MNADDVKTVVIGIIIGGVILVLEYHSGLFIKKSPDNTKRSFTPMGVIIAVSLTLLVIVGLNLYLQSQVPSVTITVPEEQSEISQITDILGRHQHITNDTEIWIYVAVGNQDRFFTFKAIKSQNGTWIAEKITVGLPEDKEKRFRIGVFTANTKASVELVQHPGERSALPNGTFLHEEIVVVRQK